MDYKKIAEERFKKDIYACELTGIQIEEVEANYAKCRLQITKNHLNAADFVMGGAIFTLADFTFAVAANSEGALCVSLSSQISFVNASKGPVLIAEAKCIENKKRLCFYEILISDNTGNIVAKVSTTGFRKL